MDSITEQPTLTSPPPENFDILWNQHNERPVPVDLWGRVIARGKFEEAHNIGTSGPYGDIPLDDFIKLADRVKAADTSIARYQALTEPAPTGALWFDTLLGLSSPEVVNTVKYFINQARWTTGLDLGTGTGVLSRAIVKHCHRVIALDQNASLLKIAQERHGQTRGGKFKIHETSGDIKHLPLASGSVDLAVSSGLTAWLPFETLDSFAGEVARVLTPEGFYISAIPISSAKAELAKLTQRGLATAKTILADMIVDVVNGSDQMTPRDIISPQKFMEIFQNHGFEPFFKILPQYEAAVLSFQKSNPVEQISH